MKLAILGSRGVPATYGGFETFAEEVGSRLSEKNDIEVYVTCENAQDKIEEWRGIKLVYIPTVFVNNKKFRHTGELLYDVLSICWATVRRDIDIIYYLGPTMGFYLIIPRVFGKKIITNVGGLEWKRRKFNRFVRFFILINTIISTKLAHLTVSDSRAIQKYIKENHNIDSIFIPYGAHITKCEDRNLLIDGTELSREEYYLVVARLIPDNNIDVILEGYIMSNSRKKLVIVGGISDQNNYIKKLLTIKGDNNNIIFLGAVYDKELLSKIRCLCCAYIHGHEKGGTNPSLLEAMGCGNLILAKDVLFNREVADKSAYYFKDAEELCTLIKDIEDKNMMHFDNMKKEALSRIRNIYNWEKIACTYYEAIVELGEDK